MYDYGYDYGYRVASRGMETAETAQTVMIIALILALVGMILSLIFITPAKKRGNLPKFLQVLHDIFNFNGLIIEVIMKALYIFMTIFMILVGFFTLFIGGGMRSFLIMILGPIVLRVAFELWMLLILLIKNVIQINGKLKDQNDKKESKTQETFGFNYAQYAAQNATPVNAEPVNAEPVNAAPEQEESYVYCRHCGSRVSSASAFCTQCGNTVE